MSNEGGEQLRERALAAVRRRVEVLDSDKSRRRTEVSLVATLCASALAPVAIAGLTLGPAVVAGVGLVGTLGATKLSEVIDKALDALRGKGEAPTAEAVEQQLVMQFELALSEVTESGSQLLAAATELLRATDTLHGNVVDSLAELDVRFGGFNLLAVEIHSRIAELGQSQHDQAVRSEAQSAQLARLVWLVERISTGETGQLPPFYAGCPYLGLLPYGAADAQLFHGRNAATLRLARKLTARLDSGEIQVLTGASGAGKSSLLRAGLVPALNAGTVSAETRSWECRVFTPTDRPLRQLAGVLAPLAARAEDVVQIYSELLAEPRRVAMLAEQAARRLSVRTGEPGSDEHGRPRLVLIVDQFEELFTHVGTTDSEHLEQTQFIEALEALSAPVSESATVGPALVVVAIRGDFIDRAAAIAPLARAIAGGPFVLEPVTEAELREVITGPAGEAGLSVDDDLVQTLVDEARARSDALGLATGVLPLISQVMARVWKAREGDRLTVRSLRRVGGLADAVDRDVTEVYEQLNATSQLIAKAVFLRLTVTTDDGRVARRRADREELCQAANADRTAVDAVVEAFAQRRLLVVDEGGQVEISHEVLLQAWGMLQGWLDADRLDHARYSRVTADAAAWQESVKQDAGYLYMGARLEEYAEAQARWSTDPQRYPRPSALVERFLQASRSLENRRARRRQGVIASLTALMLLASSVAGIAAVEYKHAESDLRQAEFRQLLALAQSYQSRDASLSARFALAAYELDPTEQALIQLTQTDNTPLATTIPSPTGGATSVVYADAGKVLAIGGRHAALQLWSMADPADPVLVNSSTIGSAGNGVEQVSASGTTLAVGLANGQVEPWNVADPARPIELGGPLSAGSKAVQGLSLSADGSVLAAGDADGTVTVWSLANPASPRQLSRPISAGASAVTALKLTPDGKSLLVAQASSQVETMSATNLSTQVKVTTASGSSDSAIDLAVSPTGSVAVEAAVKPSFSSGSLYLAAPATSQFTNSGFVDPTNNSQYYSALAFAPNGLLAVGGNNGIITLNNLRSESSDETPSQVGPKFGGRTAGAVRALAFNPNSSQLAAADQNGAVQVWSIPSTFLEPQFDGTVTAASGPNGKLLAAVGDTEGSSGTDPFLMLWSLTDAQHPDMIYNKQATGQDVCGGASSVQFGDNGGVLLAGCSALSTIWRFPDLGSPVELDTFSTPTSVSFEDVALSPTRPLAAATDFHGGLYLWNLQHMPSESVANAKVSQDSSLFGWFLNFDPTGKYLAALVENNAETNATIQLWAVSANDGLKVVSSLKWASPANPLWAMSFSPDGHELALADLDGGIQLVSISPSGSMVYSGPSVSAASDQIQSMSFDSAGDTLAAVDDADIWLWHHSGSSLTLDGEIPIGRSDGTASPNTVSFIPGSYVLESSGGGAGTGIELWNLNPSTHAQSTWICDSTRGALTRQNWGTYVTGAYVSTCGE